MNSGTGAPKALSASAGFSTPTKSMRTGSAWTEAAAPAMRQVNAMAVDLRRMDMATLRMGYMDCSAGIWPLDDATVTGDAVGYDCGMRIRITRNGHRNSLACQRPDGTAAFTDIGPGLPHHDLAHYVVERQFNLKEGFFGNIARGFTPAQLSDKEVIKRLGPESAVAEVLARALQSLSSGACERGQFAELVNAEFLQWGVPQLAMDPAAVDAMAEEFLGLLQRFAALADRESMTLEFDTRIAAHG